MKIIEIICCVNYFLYRHQEEASIARRYFPQILQDFETLHPQHH